VGSALLLALRARSHEAVGTHLHHPLEGGVPLDITDPAAVERVLGDVSPAWVFCPASLTHVDYCEDHPAEAFAMNRDGPLHAARVAARLGAGFVYYSTDYVFDGARGPYGEDDPPHPLSVYGRTKSEAERALLADVPGAIVVRSTWVYGPDRREMNFVHQLIRSCRAGRVTRVPEDQVSTPTYSVDLAAASVELAGGGRGGLWHLAGSRLLDRYTFARLACEAFDLDASLLAPVRTAALGQKAPRPLKGGLRIAKAQAALTTPLRPAEAGLRAMRAALEARAAPRGER
jgi:dTDP-4-dehydrorhamnose reductase